MLYIYIERERERFTSVRVPILDILAVIGYSAFCGYVLSIFGYIVKLDTISGLMTSI